MNEDNDDDTPIFEMDGSEHIKIAAGCGCRGYGKKCECGGYMHYQPIYGGYYYKCEDCLKDE